MTVEIKGICKWCGNQSGTDEHHLFRRSASPELINDPNNKVLLCRRCHQYVTDSKEIETLFQYYFFLKPERKDLTVDYISGRMREGAIISPRDISRYRVYLAAEYQFLNDRFVTLESQKPFKVEEFRKQEGVTSEARAERLYVLTEDGVEYTMIHRKLKTLEKMMSALRTALEQYQYEAKGTY